MSKKSRRRNKRLALLLTLAGGAALMGRGKGPVSTAGQPVGVDRISTNAPPIGGTDHIIKKAPKVVTGTEYPGAKKVVSDPPIRTHIYRGSGKKLSDTGQTIGASGVDSSGLSRGQRAQIMQAKANAPKGIYPPGMIPMPRRVGNLRGMNRAKGGRIGAKKGGRVTGIAKRGFGRALMKGKK